MRLQSVRDLKLEIAVEVFAPIAERLLDRALSVGKQLQVPSPLRRLCLGIAKGGRAGDFRLAVRLQSQSAILQTLVERVREKVGGEIDVSFIGRVKPLGKKPAKPAGKKAGGVAQGPTAEDMQKPCRPLVIGCSVGHFQTTAGTLGLIAKHRKTGRTVLLSNSHVFAQAGLAAPGDAVTQPGKLDGGGANDHVAALLDFVPMKPQGSNFIDAAIAVVDDSIGLSAGMVPGIGAVTVPAVEPIQPGQKVKKVGRSSGLTQGEIVVTELDDVAVDYPDVGTITFDDQIEIRGLPGKPFSTDGDSGSLVVNANNGAVGLLFAGNPFLEDGRGLSFANPLPKVITALDLVTV